MKESRIEAYCRAQVLAHGGLVKKWVSPGTIGVMDDIVFWPGGRVDLIEFKAPGQKPRPAQAMLIEKFRDMGHNVYVFASIPEVDDYIRRQLNIMKVKRVGPYA